MPETRPETYHSRQRLAHWLVVLLVAIQLLFNEGMVRAYGSATRGEGWPDSAGATLHGAVGLAILGLMLWRLSLRRRLGAPPPPSELSPRLQRLSRANHVAFYAVLIGMPIVGATAALTLNDGLARLHAATAPVLVALIIAHVAGATWHATTPGSGVLGRMLPSSARGAGNR